MDINKRVDQYGVLGDLKSTNAHRRVPLPPDLVAMLRKWREVCPENEPIEVITGRRGTKSQRRVLKNLNPLNLVFPTSTGTYQNPSNLHNRVWVPLQMALGLKDPVLTTSGHQKLDEFGQCCSRHRYRIYSLRHVYARLKIRLGANAKETQMLMGHASIQFTMEIYGHLWRDESAEAKGAIALDEHILALKRRASSE